MCFDLGFLWPKRDAQIRRENPSISWEYKKSDLVLTRVTSLVSHLVSGSVDGAGAGAWEGRRNLPQARHSWPVPLRSALQRTPREMIAGRERVLKIYASARSSLHHTVL